MIEITEAALAASRVVDADTLVRDHFTDWWVGKTKVSRVATPFTHSDYRTLYRKDDPFMKALDD